MYTLLSQHLKTIIQRSKKTYETEQNDHEHCCFCCEKIDKENPEAYCTTDLNDWICLQCYEDFKEQFQWQIEKGKG